jgi:RNA polymerase subunit RPABC4/transcription elongation factor Spt4
MNKRIQKKKSKVCDFCSKKSQTKEIYGDLQICKSCIVNEERTSAIAESIEG